MSDLATILEILSSIGSALSLEDALAAFAERVAHGLDVSGCTVLEWNRQENRLVVLADYVSPQVTCARNDASRTGVTYSLTDYPAAARVLGDSVPAVLDGDDPQASGREKAGLARLGWARMLIVPMVYLGKPVGLMGLGIIDRHGNRFSQDDTTLCQTLANQAAVAVESTRLHDEIETMRLRNGLLHAISQVLALETDQQRIMEHVAEFARQLVNAQCVYVAVPEAEEFIPVAVAGHGGTTLDAGDLPISLLNRSVVDRAVREQRAILVSDSPAESIFEMGQGDLNVWGIRALAVVPLLSTERVLAVLVACARRADAFSPDDLTVLSGVASRAAISLQNVQLRARLEAQHQVLRLVSLRMVNAQEEERRHISRELHDELGQALTALKINLDLARRALPDDASATLCRSLQEASSLAVSVLERARDLSLKFHPTILDDLGLVSALRWEVDRYEQRTGQSVQFEADLGGAVLQPELEITLYRIITEALTNVARHAQANHIRVYLGVDERQVVARVEDDGIGFDAADWFGLPAERRSLGLIGMRERAGLLGGQLEVISQPGCGTQVRALFPIASGRLADGV